MWRHSSPRRRKQPFHFGQTNVLIYAVQICLILVCLIVNLISAQEETVDLSTLSLNPTTARPSVPSIKRNQSQELKFGSSRAATSEQTRRKLASNKKYETQTTDCLKKLNEILSRQGIAPSNQGTRQSRAPVSSSPKPLVQILRPNFENSATTESHSINETQLANNFDGEHVPKCNWLGGYEPIQCHRIGYCWCVNKYGQAIKNTAVKSDQKRDIKCDSKLYDSDKSDSLVVVGISNTKNLLNNVSSFESTTPNGHINFESNDTMTEHDDSGTDETRSTQRKNRVPIMPLGLNDCQGSRLRARERASKFLNDTIWIPDCDPVNENLYAERQCHRSKVCWCVDQSTGLPLRSKEMLAIRSTVNNCTELKKLLELTSQQKLEATFYSNSSVHCDSEKRVDFVIALNIQFKKQIDAYIKEDSSRLKNLPPGISSTDPFLISEAQVSRWKFTIMDQDKDSKLGDREWAKIKNNFKMVERTDELEDSSKQRRKPGFPLVPVIMLRSQRKCWRDFLDFCASGDLLVKESISLSKWLGCTEVPTRSYNMNKRGGSAFRENPYVHSREAAINRSQNVNPLVKYLKPD